MNLETVWKAILLACSLCFGGWYECYNYEGSIGEHPVVLSMQLLERSGPRAGTIEIHGNYRYKSRNTPILIHGRLDVATSKARVYEFKRSLVDGSFNDGLNLPKDSAAVFEFQFDSLALKGVWTNLGTDQKLPFHLGLTSKFQDVAEQSASDAVAIPQSYSTPSRYFVGSYVYSPDGAGRGSMVSLEVYDKKSNQRIQVIDFSDYTVGFGNVATQIHENVSITRKGFWIWSDMGRMGTEVEFQWNRKTRQYELTDDSREQLSDFR